MVLILGFLHWNFWQTHISLNTIELVWYRMLIAFITLLTFLAFKKRINKNQKKKIFLNYFLLVALLLYTGSFFESIKVSNVSVAVVCLSTASFFLR